jgi:hypothetical protein
MKQQRQRQRRQSKIVNNNNMSLSMMLTTTLAVISVVLLLFIMPVYSLDVVEFPNESCFAQLDSAMLCFLGNTATCANCTVWDGRKNVTTSSLEFNEFVYLFEPSTSIINNYIFGASSLELIENITTFDATVDDEDEEEDGMCYGIKQQVSSCNACALHNCCNTCQDEILALYACWGSSKIFDDMILKVEEDETVISKIPEIDTNVTDKDVSAIEDLVLVWEACTINMCS